MRFSIDDRALTALRDAVSELARQSGRGVSRKALVALAGAADGYELSIYAGDPPVAIAHPRASSVFAALTVREREVAALVARGCGNAEIAAALFISEATVKDHVHNILRKSGLKTRAGVAGAWGR
jgi:two-component system, NarL family, nitrate/nitrite response regulator NarL